MNEKKQKRMVKNCSNELKYNFFTKQTNFPTYLKKILVFTVQRFFVTNFLKNDCFLTERTILLDKLFYYTNDFTERPIFLNKQLYLTKDFAQNRSVKK